MSTASDTQRAAALAMLPKTPGKIIAVHLSYESRAAERGRRPSHPSYFFKASSSLAGTSGKIERPAGTELLAFEGEIALIIGTECHRVSEDNAWAHVGWVTAANDFGLYDLRTADKGSNVRSKGRDGYTPIGPTLLDARTLDPAAITIRTRVNGKLVQDDSSAGMIFSLAQMVADLSQHFTLEVGDVILSGTPAGSSVVVPGDTVTVEVFGSNLSTGPLSTSVIQGTVEFDPGLGDLPRVDDKQREEAWGKRQTAGSSEGPLTEQMRRRLIEIPVASLSAQLRRRGLNNVSIDGVAAMHPDKKLVGAAKTLRFLPNREDLFRSHGGGHNAQKQAFDSVSEGEVIVIEARGESGSGTLGDVLALRAHVRGAAGIVTDGGVRDYAATRNVGIPVFTRGPHPGVLGRKHVPWETDTAVACGGATVLPGDIIVGDQDGVIVIPPSLLDEVVAGAEAAELSDGWVATQVENGAPLEGLFPMNAKWKARYDEWLQNQS